MLVNLVGRCGTNRDAVGSLRFIITWRHPAEQRPDAAAVASNRQAQSRRADAQRVADAKQVQIAAENQ
jgi:hypothetical protein